MSFDAFNSLCWVILECNPATRFERLTQMPNAINSSRFTSRPFDKKATDLDFIESFDSFEDKRSLSKSLLLLEQKKVEQSR